MVFHRAEEAIQVDGKRQVKIMKTSQLYELNKIKLYVKLVSMERDSPGVAVAFAPNAVHAPHNHGKKRIGRPRQNWMVNTSELFWNERIKMKYAQIGPFENFNPRNNMHVDLVQQEAKHMRGRITEANGGEE